MIMDETFSCVRQIENRMKNLYQQYNILSRSTNELRNLKETLKSSSDPQKVAVPKNKKFPKSVCQVEKKFTYQQRTLDYMPGDCRNC